MEATMFIAEIALAFLMLLPLCGALGLRPHALVGLPPLNLLDGVAGAGVLEFLALVLSFAAFQVALLAAVAAAGWLRGDGGRERFRATLARGRADVGLRPLLWTILAVAPLLLALLTPMASTPATRGSGAGSDALDRPLLAFVVLLIALTAAQTLRPFTLEQFVGGTRTLGATVRELASYPGAITPVAPPAADPPAAAATPTPAADGWYDLRAHEEDHDGHLAR